MSTWGNAQLLRSSKEHEARVTFLELFFDLIYVFAVTQISHQLLNNLTFTGAAEACILWFAVWLGWQYNAWFTNWFDPERLPVRFLQFFIMLLGLIMAAALPEAFNERGLIFALCYAGMQVTRSLFAVASLGSHELVLNYRRILVWSCLVGLFWILGGINTGALRLLFWTLGVLAEYLSPMIGFYLPGLGRSRTSDWTIFGGHLAERCQLFMIVALGESILITGSTFSHHQNWDIPTLIALLVSFTGSLAMWWIYFDTSSKDGSTAITESNDPGRIGAYFHYIHVTLIAGVIVSAVGNELVIAHPDAHITNQTAAVLILGPALYLLGNLLYKYIVYGQLLRSHLLGLLILLALTPLAFYTDLLLVNGLTTLLLCAVALKDGCHARAVGCSIAR